MRFDVLTIFPEFFAGPLDYGIIRRARQAGLIDVHVHDLRDFTHDRHRTVDDRPFGGGEGMVLKPEPIFEAVESLLGAAAALPAARPPAKQAVVLLSASGRLFQQPVARRLAGMERMLLLCGRYEGVDERVAEHLATEELSIGDFVLTGGELAAAVVLDAVARLLPGALGNEASAQHESFSAVPAATDSPEEPFPFPAPSAAAVPVHAAPVLLDFPQYTRPAEFRGWSVPEVLLSGNHEEIRRWRRRKAWEKTARNRPDLLGRAAVAEQP